MAAQQFYAVAGLMSVLLPVLALGVDRADYHRDGLKAAVITQPTAFRWFCPAIHARPSLYLALCYLAPVMLLVASVWPDVTVVRVMTALVTGMYAVAESSITNSHRDYLVAYCTMALAVSPTDQLAEGFALGMCVNFLASSGYAKLVVGGSAAEASEFKRRHGRRGWGWLEPETLRVVLAKYAELPLHAGGPVSPTLNQWLQRHDGVLQALSLGTLIFEVVLTPASLLFPSNNRNWVSIGAVLLHVGIALFQSGLIGVAFLPGLAAYILGFGSQRIPVGSSAWWLALILGIILPAVYLKIRRRTMVPEDWPISPFALFPWSGLQWKELFDRFATGETRIVLVTAQVATAIATNGLEGRYVRSKHGYDSHVAEAAEADREGVLHSGWELFCGETLVHKEVLDAIDFSTEWDPATFCGRVEQWLRTDQRLVEIATATPLTRCLFVRVGFDGVVLEVLAEGKGNA